VKKLHNGRQVWSWAFYDWANSSFTTIILTFVYSAYFAKSIAPNEVDGAAWWSYALAVSGIGVAILGPLCGAIADRMGRIKRWTALGMIVCLAGTLALWMGAPNAGQGTIFMVLAVLAVANIGFELSIVFSNALLPVITTPDQLGRVSSMAWGIGYFGSLIGLAIVLFGLIGLGDLKPWIDLPRENAEHIRACVIVVTLWYALFSIPFFVFVKDKPASSLPAKEALRSGLLSLRKNLKGLLTDRVWRNFMIGSAIYRDGLATLFAMGGIYAATRYNLQTADILIFGIGINVTAGIGCVAASFLEDRAGSLRVIRFSLVALVLLGLAVLWAPDKMIFFSAALVLGLFVGPVQSASRTLVARLSAPEEVTERYGLYALTGRAVAFLGPLCFGLATDLFHSQQAGMATILLFWITGFMLVRTLRDPS
jgi:UMF1 family MFS transporter